MKRIIPYILILSMLFTGCYTAKPIDEERLTTPAPSATPAPEAIPEQSDETSIFFTRHGITVDGAEVIGDSSQAVYIDSDIVYYEAGHDFTYGEGTAEDEHSAEEAAAHIVVHITKPGTYRLSGYHPAAQVAVDLGEDAVSDPNAVVTLILDSLDITCTVAPAIIFYNVYECADKDNPTMDADTSAAGANVIIADGSTNNIIGSHVARIYESVTLSEDGREVVDSKKLHKYDAAFYSKMSMNISGSGTLSILGDNEGLGSEMHLTINSGDIWITSGNDGINTNEDGVSVTTINGGTLNIRVSGETGEGDGIDSNGWLVINDGSVLAMSCASSMDSGIDADNGVYINGGSVVATGNMLDRIEGSQTYAVFSFAQSHPNSSYILRDSQGNAVFDAAIYNSFSNMILSSPELVPGTYSFWLNDSQLGGIAMEGGMGGRPGFGSGFFDSVPKDSEGEPIRPEDFDVHVYPVPGGVAGDPPPEDGFNRKPPEHSDGFNGLEPPEYYEDDIMPPPGGFFGEVSPESLVGEFEIKEGANFFGAVDILPVG